MSKIQKSYRDLSRGNSVANADSTKEGTNYYNGLPDLVAAGSLQRIADMLEKNGKLVTEITVNMESKLLRETQESLTWHKERLKVREEEIKRLKARLYELDPPKGRGRPKKI